MAKKTIEQNQKAWRSDTQLKTKRLCKGCRRKKYGVSNRGYCVDCSVNRVKEHNRQLIEKKGPKFSRWKSALKRSLKEL